MFSLTWKHNLAPRLPFLALALFVGACHSGTKAESPVGASNEEGELEPQLDEVPAAHTEVSPTVVRDAARPFSGYRAADGLALGDEELLTYLASADALCIGERHDNALDHYGQLRTIEGFLERRPMRGFELGLGLEMVANPEQSTLNSLMRGTIESDDLPGLLSWPQTWGFPYEYYAPQVNAAYGSGSDLLALGVERRITRKIAEGGLSALDQEDLQGIPELDEEIPGHRELFTQLMEGHPVGSGDLDNYYTAQLVWDESMAERSAQWLEDRRPGRKLIILAGTAHCHRSAVVARLSQRTGLAVTNLLILDAGQRPVLPKADGNLEQRIAAGYDYQMVFQR